MQIYLVGGAVRDQLLGRSVKEHDWVVVGATPQQMLALGYRPVGKDFPVFLHPQTHEEYALARTERKTALGYKGFAFYAAPEVTLVEDLKRRDLTINAIARSAAGEIIDPYGGQADLQAKRFKHVSDAFVEDPVRILRVARFAARLGDFSVHQDTLQLMRAMVNNGEVNALVAERVWQEWERALVEPYPTRFFAVLQDCGALDILFPELKNNLTGLQALKNTVGISDSAVIRFAALLFPLNKKDSAALCARYHVPHVYRELALMVCEQYVNYTRVYALTAEALLTMLESLDAFRRPQRFEQFLIVCAAIEMDSESVGKIRRMQQACAVAKSVDAAPFIKRGLVGVAIKNAMRTRQLALLGELL